MIFHRTEIQEMLKDLPPAHEIRTDSFLKTGPKSYNPEKYKICVKQLKRNIPKFPYAIEDEDDDNGEFGDEFGDESEYYEEV